MSENTIIYKGDDLTITIDDDYTIYSGVTATIITDGQRKATGRFADNVIRVESDELKKLNSGVIAYHLSYYMPDPDFTDGKYNQSEVVYTNYYLMDSNQFGAKADQSEVNNNLNSRLNSVEEKTAAVAEMEKATPIIITARVGVNDNSLKLDNELETAKRIIKEQGKPIVMYVGHNNPLMYTIPLFVEYDNESDEEIYAYIVAESPEAIYKIDVYYNYGDSDEEDGRYTVVYDYEEKEDEPYILCELDAKNYTVSYKSMPDFAKVKNLKRIKAKVCPNRNGNYSIEERIEVDCVLSYNRAKQEIQLRSQYFAISGVYLNCYLNGTITADGKSNLLQIIWQEIGGK